MSEVAWRIARQSFAYFCSHFLYEHFPRAIPSFHHELIAELTGHDEHTLFILPRSHSKTTLISKAYVLWQLLYRREHFIALFSNTDKQAVGILDDIRRTLKNNLRILAAFGDLLPKPTRENGVVDNDHEIITTTGICIRVAGSGTEVRGWNFGPYRPQLIIGDDLESRDTVATKDQRDKLEKWWDADVFPMRDLNRARILIVGTILHIDSVLARKIQKKALKVFRRKALLSDPTRSDLWDEWARVWNEGGGKPAARAFYAAHKADMDAGAEVLWPDGKPLLDLLETRKEQGPFAFQTEYQNNPIPDEERVFHPDWLLRCDLTTEDDGTPISVTDGSEVIPIADLTIYGAIDPAISEKASADYFVLATLGRHADGRMFLLDMIRDRMNIYAQIEAVFTAYRTWHHQKIGVETVMFQKVLKQLIDGESAKAGLYIPTIELRPDTDKVRRARRWQPTVEQGLLKIASHIPASIVEEIADFPRAQHDDTVDGLTYAMETATHARSPRLFAV